jgi:transcriptional regulator with XRE-family HTH domain
LIASEAANPAGSFESWCANQVGSLIAQSANWHRPANWEPSTDIRLVAKQAGLATPAHIARVLQTSKVTVWYWLNGKSRPTLPMALELYSKLGASLAARILRTKPEVETETQPVFHFRRDRRVRTQDWMRTRQHLLRELASSLTRSLRAICREERVAVRAVRGKFPDLCKRVVATRRNQQREMRRIQDRDLRKAISRATEGLTRQGEEITLRLLEHQLARPGLFNSRAGRRALRNPDMKP